MSVFKNRKWKTVELTDVDIADFTAMGGLEIDVLSDDGEVLASLKNKRPVAVADMDASKKKKKKQKKAVVEIETPKSESPTPIPADTVDMSEWDSFGLNPLLMSGLTELKFTTPSPIQAAVIKQAIAGLDVLGAAQTGSGKTLAFGLPIMHSILATPVAYADRKTSALCILPTRELAMQVRDHLTAIVPDKTTILIGTIIGGMSVQKQKRILAQHPQIIVGTPGRLAGLLGLVTRKEDNSSSDQIDSEFKLQLVENLKFLVLDEADRLLEESHFRDLTNVLRFIYNAIAERQLQSFIFSATLGDVNGKLLRKLKLQPKRHIVDLTNGDADEPGATPTLSVPSQLKFKTLFPTSEADREPFLIFYLQRRIQRHTRQRMIVFVNAISYVYRLAALLPLCFEDSVKVVGIHSKMKQKDRLKKLDQFKAAPVGIMIATDLAARGLDLPNVDAVVHLQAPRTPESLLHRSGRTARAGNAGECAMIIVPNQMADWNKAIRLGIKVDVESIDTITVSSNDLKHVRDIQKLACEIESKSHTCKKESKDKAWTKRMCEEAELWNSDESTDEVGSDDDMETKKSEGIAKHDAEQLQQLIRSKLPSLRN
jgi:ATP-dependent RNA helicase DDX24/MAK5